MVAPGPSGVWPLTSSTAISWLAVRAGLLTSKQQRQFPVLQQLQKKLPFSLMMLREKEKRELAGAVSHALDTTVHGRLNPQRINSQ